MSEVKLELWIAGEITAEEVNDTLMSRGGHADRLLVDLFDNTTIEIVDYNAAEEE